MKRLSAVLILAALVGCASTPAPARASLPHLLRLSQRLWYDDGTESGTDGSVSCVRLPASTHQIGVVSSTTGGDSAYTGEWEADLVGHITPSGEGPAVFADGTPEWDNLKEMGMPADLMGVWVEASDECFIFYPPMGGV